MVVCQTKTRAYIGFLFAFPFFTSGTPSLCVLQIIFGSAADRVDRIRKSADDPTAASIAYTEEIPQYGVRLLFVSLCSSLSLMDAVSRPRLIQTKSRSVRRCLVEHRKRTHTLLTTSFRLHTRTQRRRTLSTRRLAGRRRICQSLQGHLSAEERCRQAAQRQAARSGHARRVASRNRHHVKGKRGAHCLCVAPEMRSTTIVTLTRFVVCVADLSPKHDSLSRRLHLGAWQVRLWFLVRLSLLGESLIHRCTKIGKKIHDCHRAAVKDGRVARL